MQNPLAPYVNVNTILVFIVYSLNFLLLVGALVTLYICISESRQKDIMENIDINFEFLIFFTKTLMVIALIVALVSLLGCVGIAIDNDYMLIAYIIIIGILMAAQIILSSYLSHKLVGSEEDIRKKILNLIKGYTLENPNKLDGFQIKYACCGIDDYRDYLGKDGIGFIPGSCCQKKSSEKCSTDLVHSKTGCNKAIIDEIAKILKGSYIVIFTIFILEVVLAICSILVIMDVGQPDEDNTSDEIVVVAPFRKKFPKDGAKVQESIDTHDTDNIQSPIAKEEEIEGLYDEEKNIQKTAEKEGLDEEPHDKDDTKQNTEEEIPEQEEKPAEEFHGNETVEVENVASNTQDEEIYLEGNLDEQSLHEMSNAENTDETITEETQFARKINTNMGTKDETGKKSEKNDDEEEEEEEEGEEESPVAGNQTKFEENIHVLKSKRSDRKKYVEKVRKERNRERKRLN